MPHNKNHKTEKLYVPGQEEDEFDVDRYIDGLDGFDVTDLEELEDELGEELSEEELIEKKRELEGIEDEFDSSSVFTEYEYKNVPKIPEQYRASDIIGKRTQASGSNGIPIGAIRPKNRLRDIWNDLVDVEKYILMLISEHRHLTIAQLSTLIVTPSKLRLKKGAINNTKTYYEWVTKQKYGIDDMNYKSTFKVATMSGLQKKITALCKLGLIEEITPSYGINEHNISARYLETPALFTHHYYLTPLGARVLICCTDVNQPSSKVKPIGYVPSYKNAAFTTILHEAECTEILCSIISCAAYVTNPDDLSEADNNMEDETPKHKGYGLFDICRFYHEKDIEENVTYQGKKTKFKPDGKLTLYVERVSDFIDWYIEYDSGSSKESNLSHKIEAFIKYIFDKRQQYGERFRKPIFLLVTQKPADFFPSLNARQKKKTTYATAIKNSVHKHFEEYLDIINDVAIVLIADCSSIRQHGALGACWHKIDLITGIPDMKAYDLITASLGMYEKESDIESHVLAHEEDVALTFGDPE